MGMTAINVKIKSYNELKDKPWFVEDMRIYSGMTTSIAHVIDDDFVLLTGCSDWQWKHDGYDIVKVENRR